MFNKLFIIGGVVTAVAVGLFSVNQMAVANNASEPKSIVNNIESAQAELNVDMLKAKIKAKLGLTINKVEKTPVPGIALLMSDQGVFYSSYDGDYFIQGKVYSLVSKVTDLSEASLAKVRLDGVDEFKDDMIVFKAKDEKYVVSAFTDISCGYCRKMHKQMAEYNDLGITFRYLAFPRAGIKDQAGNYSQGFKDLRSVWCNEDPKAAMTRGKNTGSVAYRVCDKPIEEQLNFGRQIGVNGTPALVLSNGMLVPGYQEPKQLLKLLESI
jgi:thiol:disulfide interchange protein DsbC